MHITQNYKFFNVFIFSSICAALTNASVIRTREIGNDSFSKDINNVTTNNSSDDSLERNSIDTGPIQTLPMLAETAKPANKTRLLKCHCDICKENNFVCETDGVCFTSVAFEKGQTQYSYRCMDRPFPPEDPIWCHEKSDSGPFYAMQCCNEDLCNINNNLTLPVRDDLTLPIRAALLSVLYS